MSADGKALLARLRPEGLELTDDQATAMGAELVKITDESYELGRDEGYDEAALGANCEREHVQDVETGDDVAAALANVHRLHDQRFPMRTCQEQTCRALLGIADALGLVT